MTEKNKVKAVIVILVGPLGSRNKYEHIVDTVQSVIHYASPESRILIQDNSAPLNLGARLQAQFPQLSISRAPQNYGLFGGLYKSVSLAFQLINEQFAPEVVIIMDTDALFTDYGLEDAAIAYFKRSPEVGLMGNYLSQGAGIAWAAEKLGRQLNLLGWLRDRERYRLLHELAHRAHGNGWRDGQHVLGGVAIYNPNLIRKMGEFNYLNREPLRRTFLQVDHIFGLLCAACGMDMAHFHIPENPFAVVWRGMPISPTDILTHGVKAFHSTRSWKDAEREWDEDQIREFFALQRQEQLSVPRASASNE